MKQNVNPKTYFFDQAGLNKAVALDVLKESLKGMDDGELYLEHTLLEGIAWQDGRVRSSSFNVAQGFGLRSVLGETIGYAHSDDFSDTSMKRAGETVRAIKNGQNAVMAAPPQLHSKNLYTDQNPIDSKEFKTKVDLLEDIDRYVRAQNPLVQQVSASLRGSWRLVNILRADGQLVHDVRPMASLNVHVSVEKGDRTESGHKSLSARIPYTTLFESDTWERLADEALRVALLNLETKPAPAGEMPVALGSGTPAVLLHEAVGHGLEADSNRNKISIFSDRIGENVASKGVTVIDRGTYKDQRGSLSIDDEGTPTGSTTLIEDGKLVGYMQDRQNARLMGMEPTGNGRRESYAHAPMPRMTNTLMTNGSHQTEEMISSVKKGLYAVSLSGGQVDITSGKFVFSTSEAYLIEDGKVTAPVKDATLIGNGPDVMTKIDMIGNNMEIASGGFACGKNGQSVPVGIGMPSAKVSSMTVGGTST